MTTTRSTLTALGLVAASLALAAPASAVSWGSSSDPVRGYDHGKAFGKMYGRFYNDKSVSAMSTTYQFDLQPKDGNAVRVETDFYFWRNCNPADEAPEWCLSVSKQTDRTSTASWRKFSRARNLSPTSPRVRGGINICEIQSWSNDPCSPLAIPRFTY